MRTASACLFAAAAAGCVPAPPAPAPGVTVSIALPAAPDSGATDCAPETSSTPELDENCREAMDKLRATRPERVEIQRSCLPGLALLEDLSFMKRVGIAEYGPSDEPVDLSPLARASSLSSIEVTTSMTPSFGPLLALPTLRDVSIRCRVASLEAIRGLPHLTTLTVDRGVNAGTQLDDLSVLGSLPSLRVLSINRFVDVTAVAAAAPNLEGLHARASNGTDALARMQNLTALTIGCMETSAGFTAPAALRWLQLDCPELKPSTWRAFPRVEHLNVSETEINSLAGIEAMVSLKSIDAHGTLIKSLRPLARVKTLEAIDIHGSEVADLSPLAGLPRLKSIEAAPIPARSVAALATSRSLESLWLAGMPVTDVRPLAAIRTLKEVMLPRGCSRPDAVALHKVRPDIKLMEWTDGPSSSDPSCYP